MIVIGFDFSIAKPAMCARDLRSGDTAFACWPMNIDRVSKEALENAGVAVFDRNLPPIHKADYTTSTLASEHTIRAVNLASMITSNIKTIKEAYSADRIVIVSEGLSFASTGDAALDLSAYKAVLMAELYKAGFSDTRTYAPITIKSTAGCAKKGMKGKEPMIEAAACAPSSGSRFLEALRDPSKPLVKKTSYVKCTDDLVDSYWAVMTYIEKEDGR